MVRFFVGYVLVLIGVGASHLMVMWAFCLAGLSLMLAGMRASHRGR